MRFRLPLHPRIFWPTLAVVVIAIVAAWLIIPRVSNYVIEPQDYGGSSICGVILAYLIHLWLLPPDPPSSDED